MIDHFRIEEMVCPHVFTRHKLAAWSFFDPRLLIVLEAIRTRLNKAMTINNWHEGGMFDERGFRCIQCDLVKQKIASGELYVSPHMTGQAIDFDVQGLVAEEVRQWLIKNKNLLPYGIRLENNVSWVHLDTRNMSDNKVLLFNP